MLCLTMRSSSSRLTRDHNERKRCLDPCDFFEPDSGTGVLIVAGIERLSWLGTAVVGTDIRDVDRCKWRSGMKSGMRKSGMSGMRAASHDRVGRIMQLADAANEDGCGHQCNDGWRTH